MHFLPWQSTRPHPRNSLAAAVTSANGTTEPGTRDGEGMDHLSFRARAAYNYNMTRDGGRKRFAASDRNLKAYQLGI
jgi:hypothetical protein